MEFAKEDLVVYKGLYRKNTDVFVSACDHSKNISAVVHPV